MRPAETYLQNYKNWAALWYTLVILILVPQEYLKNTSHSVHCWCVVKKPGHACVSIGQDWSASVQDTGHYWPAAGAVIGQDITDQSQLPSHWSAAVQRWSVCVQSPALTGAHKADTFYKPQQHIIWALYCYCITLFIVW